MHWSQDEIDLELNDVRELDVRIVGGEITVTAGEGPTTVEGRVLRGGPLEVELTDDGVLRVAHERETDSLGFLFQAKSAKATVVVRVPPATLVSARGVTADVFVAGVREEVHLGSVSGSVTASTLQGDVAAKSVSGDVELQAIGGGDLRVTTVSGDVTATGVAGERVAVRTVSGDITLDVDDLAEGNFNTVSGAVAIRLPASAGVDLDATTMSGHLDCGFDLRRESRSRRRLSGIAGDGEARLAVRTVSGDIAVLRAALSVDDEVAVG